ncbi:MAG: hypothetical protein KQH57_17255 [Actinomycetales bacterium]|nr:hypothetical protein [Actinomycetales bacterium]
MSTTTTDATYRRSTSAAILEYVTRDGRPVAQVARAAGMLPDTLRAKLRGQRPIYIPELLALAQSFGMSPSAFAREAGL